MKLSILFSAVLLGCSLTTQAQVNAADSVMSHAGGNRFSVGG